MHPTWILPLLLCSFHPLTAQRRTSSPVEFAPFLADGNNRLALDLYKTLNSPKSNFLISPWSIYLAMGALYLTASGNTSSEMEKALSYGSYGLKEQEVHLGYRDLLTRLMKNLDRNVLETNSLALIQSGMNISEDLSRDLDKYYDITLEEVDFVHNGEKIRTATNKLVELKTKGKIPELMDKPANPYTLFLLLNAVYFKGIWDKQFNPQMTEPSTFLQFGEKRSMVNMMKMMASFKTYSDKTSKIHYIDIPFTGKAFSMLVIVPQDWSRFQQFENEINLLLLDKVLNSTTQQTVELFLPKFTIADSYHLTDAMKKLGMPSAFTQKANFTKLSATQKLYVQDIVHKTYLSVNEEGAEAAASTAVLLGSRSGLPKFYADRPFIFAIRHVPTGLFLFFGKVVHLPEAEKIV